MKNLTIEQAAGASSYPGRGIVAGRSRDGRRALLAYFIMGRSLNSRNRVFVEEGQGLRTQAHDPSKMTDPSLIIYWPVRVLGDKTIVTNGDQTDTIYQHLRDGGSFASALRTRTFEPDAPNYTPRVSCLATASDGQLEIEMRILKAGDDAGRSVNRCFFQYAPVLPGMGWFLHTYQGDGSPIPAFEGEPEKIAMPDSLEDFASRLWQSLNEDNKVALWARAIELDGGESRTLVYNKHTDN